MDTDLPFIPPDRLTPEICHTWAQDLQILGKLAEAETFYRAAIDLDPDRPRSWANLGLTVLRGGRIEEAIQCEREALRLDPTYVEAHNNLGIALHTMGALAEAGNHFRGALRLDPDHASATLNLGVVRQTLGDVPGAEDLYRRALTLGCDGARVHNNLALALAELGRLAEAEQACRDSLADQPGYPEASVNLAMILLMRGKLAEAWPLYEARWQVAPLSRTPRPPEDALWTGQQEVAGRTILLLAEQGFGDTLQFCRYAPILAAAGAKVILAVPSPLVALMRSLDGVRDIIGEDDPVPPYDLHCPMLSLPGGFGTTLDSIPNRVPYLSADVAAVAAMEDLLPARRDARGPRIGLVWAGGRRPGEALAMAIDKKRSMTLADLAPIAAVPECVFVSLQVGPPARQAEASTFPLIDLTGRLSNFADTAALIQTLDLVISVDTAVAHLAAAMGKPVWLLNRFDACWRWLPGLDAPDRSDTPWYPTMRLFRQTEPGDWASVVRRVAEALPGFQTVS